MAQMAVGACLQDAWSAAGYNQAFSAYEGSGVVEFGTGTQASPTGSYAAETLIDVDVYANGKVTGLASEGAGELATATNAGLAHWGCNPNHPGPPTANPSAAPSTSQASGVQFTCTPIQEAGGPVASVTVYNPGPGPYPLSGIMVEWFINGQYVATDGGSVSEAASPIAAGQSTIFDFNGPANGSTCKASPIAP
jgi:hypothetical protein